MSPRCSDIGTPPPLPLAGEGWGGGASASGLPAWREPPPAALFERVGLPASGRGEASLLIALWTPYAIAQGVEGSHENLHLRRRRDRRLSRCAACARRRRRQPGGARRTFGGDEAKRAEAADRRSGTPRPSALHQQSR